MNRLFKGVIDLSFKFPEDLGFMLASIIFGFQTRKDIAKVHIDHVIPEANIITRVQGGREKVFENSWLSLLEEFLRKKRSQSKETKLAAEYVKCLAVKNLKQLKAYTFESLKEEDRCLQIGDIYNRVYYLANLPNYLYAATLFRLVNLPIPLTMSYHVRGTNKAAMIRATRQRMSVLESSRNSMVKKGKSEDPEQGREMQELQSFLNDLVSDQEKAFLAGLYVSISASTKEQLLEYDRKFQDETQNIEMTFNTYAFAQRLAYKSIMPFNLDSVNEKHLLPSSAVINLLPFLTRNLNDPSGIFFGINQYNNSLILLDLFQARNANMNIFGTSGSGKSVTAKLIITRLALRNVQNIILDPEGEYGKLTENLGGQNIKLGNGFGVDPFIVFQNLHIKSQDRVQILKHFFRFYIQEHNQDTSLLDKILMQVINESEFANMSLFLKALEAEARHNNPGMCNDIRQLVNGSLGYLFKSTGAIDFSPELICFDLSGLKTDEQKLPFLYLIGSIINRLLDGADRQRMIYIDEAHKLLYNKATTDFYIDLVKTARKRKAGVVSITQNPEDFKESDNSRTIITQAETTILLKQATASINYISRFNLFRLTERECADLSSFAVGEALFIREKEHIYLSVFPFASESSLVFTS